MGKINLRETFKGWDVRTVGWTIILAMIILQGIGLIFKGLNIHLGPLLLFFLIAVTVVIGASIARDKMQGRIVGREDLIILLVLVGITTLSVIYLRQYLPEVFQPAAIQLKNTIMGLLQP